MSRQLRKEPRGLSFKTTNQRILLLLLLIDDWQEVNTFLLNFHTEAKLQNKIQQENLNRKKKSSTYKKGCEKHNAQILGFIIKIQSYQDAWMAQSVDCLWLRS